MNLTEEVKSLKESLQKKNKRVIQLNKKIKVLEGYLSHHQREHRYYEKRYNAIRQLVPSKHYKITYELHETEWIGNDFQIKTENIVACHFNEAKIIIYFRNWERCIRVIDILETAS
jgi:predicted  nucleic acid-binding Zn-ribbon protein